MQKYWDITWAWKKNNDVRHINSLLILFIINRPSDNFKCQGPVAWPFSNFNHPSLVKSGLKKYLGFPRVFLSRTQICWKANVLSRDFWIKLKNNLRAKYCFIRFFFFFALYWYSWYFHATCQYEGDCQLSRLSSNGKPFS